MAISAGLVSSIETKGPYVFWQPLTAIRVGDIDADPRTNPHPTWAPLRTTPCFPSYPSAHAAAS